VSVRYEADWLQGFMARLEIEAVSPERAPLPITETGYRSHFLAPGAVEAVGGPVAYATLWLDAEARSTAWREREQAARQYVLF
jgi:hypothetical protein